MTVRASRLVQGAQLTNVVATYYTAPTGTTAVIKRAVFSNTTASPQTITVNVVTSGGTASAANQIINARTIAPGETYVSPELAGMVISPAETVQAVSSAGAAITFMASGILIT